MHFSRPEMTDRLVGSKARVGKLTSVSGFEDSLRLRRESLTLVNSRRKWQKRSKSSEIGLQMLQRRDLKGPRMRQKFLPVCNAAAKTF